MIQYPLGVTCFTSQQCKQIQSKYLPTFLSKMGINRATATAVRHGPLHLGGFDIFNLETEQGVMATKMILSHTRKDDEVGKMLQISCDHLQLQAGVSWPVLSQHGHQQRKYVDPCYLTNLWAFLDSFNASIHFDFDQWLFPQRHNDSFIMEVITQLPGITTTDLVHAQRCRLYLGVTTIADICTSNGRSICEWALNGNDTPRTSRFTFPNQTKPATTVWNTWQRLLHLGFCDGTKSTLTHPLGKWYRGHITQVWNTAIDPQTTLLYIWDDDKTVRIYERQGRSTKKYRYLRTHTTKTFPIRCVPISGQFQAGMFITTGFATFMQPPPTTSTILPDQQLMHLGTRHHTSLPVTAQAIWDGQAILATDGSVKNNKAIYAWIISNNPDQITTDIQGGGILPPSAQYAKHASKRPEAAALYAALQWLSTLLKRYPDNTNDAGATPALPIPIDNKSVINDIQ